MAEMWSNSLEMRGNAFGEAEKKKLMVWPSFGSDEDQRLYMARLPICVRMREEYVVVIGSSEDRSWEVSGWSGCVGAACGEVA